MMFGTLMFGTMQFATHAFIPIAVERTLDSLMGGLVLSGLAWTWLRVARRQNSASRFLILFILLIGIAVLPIALLPAASLSWMAAPHSAIAETAAHPLLTLPENAAEYLFLAWSVLACAGLLRIGVGFWQLRKLKMSCVEVDAANLDSRIQTALLESPRLAILCTSDRVNVPTALGLANPARIVIPAWLMDQLSPDELHHLVLHELAHLRRWDDWSNLAQKVLSALLFFHPAVWWLQRRLALEREMACDERVLAETGNARAYAKSLATMAERSFVRRSLIQKSVALAQAAVSRLHETTLRVSKILGPGPTRKSASPLPLFASAAMVGGLTLAVAFFSPDLVSFASPVATTATASLQAPRIGTNPAVDNPTTFAPKQILASLPVAPHRSLIRKAAKATNNGNADGMQMASAPAAKRPELARAPQLIPARASLGNRLDNKQLAQPAMLIFWQETYDDGAGNVIQRSYWRVVVLHTVPQPQPKRI